MSGRRPRDLRKCKGNPELRRCDGIFVGGGRRITIPPPVRRKTITRNAALALIDSNALIDLQIDLKRLKPDAGISGDLLTRLM
jgi:hypothetical protein